MAGLVPLLVIVVVVVLIVSRQRRQGPFAGETQDPGETTRSLQRFFVYAMLFAALVIGAIGLSRLLGGVLPGRDRSFDWGSTDAALALAFSVIGVPVFALVWRYVRRGLDRNPRERRAVMWSLYVGVALTTALISAGVGAARSLEWALGGEAVPDRLADLIVWGAVWAGHWWVLRHPAIGPERLRPETLLLGSLWGLVAGLVGAGILMNAGIREAYEALMDVRPGVDPAADLRTGTAWFLSGGLAWTWYWHLHARRRERDTAWSTYVLIPGVLGGIVTALAATVVIVYTAVEWWWGNPSADTAARQFDRLPGALVAGVIGLAVWGYHRAVLGIDPATLRTEPGRTYRYLLSGTGLVAATVGLGVLVNALLESVDAGLTGAGGSINTVLLGSTLIVAGAPVWLLAWRHIGTAVRAEPGAEVPSPARRAYLITLFGAGSVVALVTLIIIVYQAFRSLLGDPDAGDLLEQVRVPLGLLLATAAIAGYHWTVWRSDRRLVPVVAGAEKVRDVILVAPDGIAMGDAIHARTGARVHLVHPTGFRHGVPTPEGAAAAVTEVHSPRVLVVVDDDGALLVLGYED